MSQKTKIIILSAFAIFTIAYAGVCFYFSGTILYPRRQPLVKNPADYGLEYRDIEFPASDGLNIQGWLIPGDSDELVIITHPGSFNRYGTSVEHQGPFKFAEKDVEFLKTARQLHDNGYWVLMFDFRNHGKSPASENGGISGVGIEEYKDVVGAVRYAESEPELKGKKIGFVSFCMGANATIVALSEAGEDLKDVKCLMAVQPVSTDVFISSFIRDTYGPIAEKSLIPLTDRICQLRGGYSLAEMSPAKYAKDIFVPTLYIQAESDPWTELDDIQGFYDDTPQPKELLMLEGDMHRFDTYNYFGEHPEKMLEFLEKYMR